MNVLDFMDKMENQLLGVQVSPGMMILTSNMCYYTGTESE